MHLKNNKNIAIISFDIPAIADDLESSLNNPALKNQVLINKEKISLIGINTIVLSNNLL